MAKVIGLGGLFWKAEQRDVLLSWYHDVLGIEWESWGGTMFLPTDLAAMPGAGTVLAPFADANHFAPSDKPFMINLVVDDLDGMLVRCKERGVAIIKQSDEAYGRFAQILDPEGTKVELWQPLASD